MRWKPFFTPVPALSTEQAAEMIAAREERALILIDCRQPGEYERGHIAGALLFPLAELADRAAELDPQKSVICYCGMGARSRIAAQLLAGKGFQEVYNLSGGYEAWNGRRAFGNPEQGLDLFPPEQPLADSLVVAYGMEEALREFYAGRARAVDSEEVASLFDRLAEVEQTHSENIHGRYVAATGEAVDQATFASRVVTPRLEGGMTVDEYMALFDPDWNALNEVLEIAMSIEAQALDLYLRASRRAADPEVALHLSEIAHEEKGHLEQLGRLLETLTREA
jgi:rhodanese-related sulfurtransferase/rubrerythrin